MLIYGDQARCEDARTILDELHDRAGRLNNDGDAWIVRHAALVDLFLRAGELVQGLDDADFALAGMDEETPRRRARARALQALAGAVLRSYARRGPLRSAMLHATLVRLGEATAQTRITTKTAEGYAYYAVYPEAYGLSAARLREPNLSVVGLRSIGASLGAIVAARTGAKLFATARPCGPPFERRLALGPVLQELLHARGSGAFAIVDEGPGMSGSSMAGCADTLESLGAAPSRIVFVPSHAGLPGAAGGETVQARWRTTQRIVTTFDDFAGGSGAPELAAWVEDITGPPLAPLEDIGGGRWRDLLPYPFRPPGGGMRERRKFLLTSTRGAFLLRFVGLGEAGQRALMRARALSDAGFVPPVMALRHGFLIERWIADARPLDPRAVDRPALIRRVAEYLAFRARSLQASEDSGASLELLAAMVSRNAELALGRPLDITTLTRAAPRLARRVRRADTDNRLHTWEWLRLPDGRILKADATDHCAGHDLIGRQDIAWDVVGAGIELGLNASEEAGLRSAMAAAGVRVDDELLGFYRPCYCAYQFGSFYLDAEPTAQYPLDRRLGFDASDYMRMLVTSGSVLRSQEPSL